MRLVTVIVAVLVAGGIAATAQPGIPDVCLSRTATFEQEARTKLQKKFDAMLRAEVQDSLRDCADTERMKRIHEKMDRMERRNDIRERSETREPGPVVRERVFPEK